MKIADVCAFYTPQGGGVKTYIRQKLEAGPKLGHEIVIIVPGMRHTREEFGPRARIVTIPGRRFPLDGRYHYFDNAGAVHAALDRENPDFVEASSPWRSASIVADWSGTASRSLIMHADPLSAYAYRWFGQIFSRERIDAQFDWFWRHLRRLDAKYDFVISASQSLSERLTAGGLQNVQTVPMGIEKSIFRPNNRDLALRNMLLSQCSLGPDATLLIGIGRQASEKRWPMIVDAVTAAGTHQPVAFIQIGSGDDGALQRKSRYNPHIRLLPPIADRNELARILASGDALIHGCEAETFCMVAAEARASALPLIVPDMGGAFDQLSRDAGIAYAAASAKSASQAILKFAANRLSYRAKALEYSEGVQAMDSHFSRLFGLYEDTKAFCNAA